MKESSSLEIKDLEELQKELLSASFAKGLANLSRDRDSAKGAKGTYVDTNNAEISDIVLDGKMHDIDDVMEMKKNIDDLMLVNESSDKKISEVGMNKESSLMVFEGIH